MDRKPERLLVAENQYKEFKKSGKKPSYFCKENLRMSDVKSYDYVFNYFSEPGNFFILTNSSVYSPFGILAVL